ncbi:hypothetical protein Riv7116_3211 [Rivularia sp. PCC 7116]|uniref:hypothetical protein n=1 Tax=Rivularia sp. PCC 7116 TaxID=373994 RepID=UPI00029EF1CF|nr:hypothetical protein [Rivularia sp. PCC 7116]AFY55682.1 hypothetical protein Riv7116_3211 [Rivularia sp. PCC 7116]
MPRKRLSDLLKEEVKKPTEGESTIDVPASEVKDMSKQGTTAASNVDLEATVKELQATLEETRKNEDTLRKQAEDFQSTIGDQEKLFNQLQKELDEAKKVGDLQDNVEELKQELAQAGKNEKSLEKLIGELQLTLKEKDEHIEKLGNFQDTVEDVKKELATVRKQEKALQAEVEELKIHLAEKEASTQRLTDELYAAKKDALQLAEANTKLTAEMNAAQKIAEIESAAPSPASRKPATKQRVPNQSAITQPKKDYSSSLAYRKHYSRPTGPLPDNSSNGQSNGSPMWLLD